jgi:hypothetical protein
MSAAAEFELESPAHLEALECAAREIRIAFEDCSSVQELLIHLRDEWGWQPYVQGIEPRNGVSKIWFGSSKKYFRVAVTEVAGADQKMELHVRYSGGVE